MRSHNAAGGFRVSDAPAPPPLPPPLPFLCMLSSFGVAPAKDAPVCPACSAQLVFSARPIVVMWCCADAVRLQQSCHSTSIFLSRFVFTACDFLHFGSVGRRLTLFSYFPLRLVSLSPRVKSLLRSCSLPPPPTLSLCLSFYL